MCAQRLNKLFTYCLALAGLFTLIGCQTTNSSGSTFQSLPGALSYYDQPVQVTLPSSAPANSPVVVKMITYATGCIAQGSTKVSMNGLQVQLEPFDWYIAEIPPDWLCTEELRLYEHTMVLSFAKAGNANVQITGRSLPDDQPVTLDYPITIY